MVSMRRIGHAGIVALLLRVVAVASAAAVLPLLRRRLLLVTVSGWSMYPTYRDGDRLLAWRGRTARRGAIVVVAAPDAPAAWQSPRGASNDPLVKRVVAVPGDRVPGTFHRVLGAADGDRVPPGRLLILGDAPHSWDSKQAGYCPREALIGVVFATLGRGPLERGRHA